MPTLTCKIFQCSSSLTPSWHVRHGHCYAMMHMLLRFIYTKDGLLHHSLWLWKMSSLRSESQIHESCLLLLATPFEVFRTGLLVVYDLQLQKEDLYSPSWLSCKRVSYDLIPLSGCEKPIMVIASFAEFCNNFWTNFRARRKLKNKSRGL